MNCLLKHVVERMREGRGRRRIRKLILDEFKEDGRY
jgi:uncharacterized protein YggL (DUF469 family)